ncbi:MAG: hypothetical protein K2P94_00190, partial [Rhodospirillaceae bacterium]|nr:hypothetical protein [Rhodospirillaceae bacterium]
MTSRKPSICLAALIAAGLCASAALSPMVCASAVAAESGAAPTPMPSSRQLGPPAGAGEGLEGSGPPPEKPVEPEAPLLPVPPPQAKPAVKGPQAPDRTKMLLGETEILDIPLAQIPNYRDAMRDVITDLATYARGRDPKFIITTRGG